MMQGGTKRALACLAISGLVFIATWAMFGRDASGGRLLDMTFVFDEGAIYWPTAKPFKLTRVAWNVSEGGWWYASNDFAASEHGGTHVDAPIHFAEGGRTIDEIPLEEWIGPAVKIDVVAKCTEDRNYMLQVADIEAWEDQNGRIPTGAWVIMYTGVGTANYPDRKAVLGTDKAGLEAVLNLRFPGFSPEAVQYLLKEREITGIALDTPSIDYGKSKDFIVHQILFTADKLALENIACLDKLPPTGATLYVIPMLIKDGTGAPARVFAVLP
jgi:kynurenine formamidase